MTMEGGPRAHIPYVPDDASLPELTLRAVVLGAILGVVFGASSLYLVLKVGLTVSASIPVAVISITLFRLASRFGVRDASILESNIVQTAGSAGESIAFGIGVTMPAIMILGFDLELTRVLLVSVLGALLGILMMIPLRRALIVQEHGKLKYPEGTACAEVLKAGAAPPVLPGGPAPAAAGPRLDARTIFVGFGIGIVYKTAMSAFRAWKDIPETVFGAPLKAGSLSAEISPELLGVGYIIGPKISTTMCAGGVLAYLVLIPLIRFFGEGATVPLEPGTVPIAQMGPDDIRRAYILYIGAGAVAAGGIISLARSLPMIWRGLRDGLRSVGAAGAPAGMGPASGAAALPRTARDLPMKGVLAGIALLVLAIWVSPPLNMNLVGAVLIVLFGFLFVTVSSRLTGQIGSSSNPISGMTVATLLLTCLIFLLLGWTGARWYVTALSVGGVVCIAASNGGTTSQDLKTGFLIGSTPAAQQVAILVGSLLSALLLGSILLRLNDASTVYVPVQQVAPAGLATDPAQLPAAREGLRGVQAASDPKTYRVWQKLDTANGPAGKYLVDDEGRAVWLVDPGINGTVKQRPDGTAVRKFDAPKATLMSYIIRGILDRHLPWGLVLFGVMIAVVLEMCSVPSLAFAVGLYLPLSSSTPALIGGAVRWLADRRGRRQGEGPQPSPEEAAAESDRSPGVLLASGYIAGGAIAGVLIAFMAGVLEKFDSSVAAWAEAHNPFFAGPYADALALIPFTLLSVTLLLTGRSSLSREAGERGHQ